MSRVLPTACLLLSAVCVLSSANQAHARKGGLVIVNTGDKVFEIAEAEEGSAAKQMFSDTIVGYHCQHFGVLWLPLWTWDGTYCIYSEEQDAYEPMEPEQISAMTGVPVDKIKKPLLYTFPLGLIIICVIIGAVIIAKVLSRGKNQTTSAATQFTGAMPPGTMPPGQAPPGGPPQAPRP